MIIPYYCKRLFSSSKYFTFFTFALDFIHINVFFSLTSTLFATINWLARLSKALAYFLFALLGRTQRYFMFDVKNDLHDLHTTLESADIPVPIK